MTQDEIVHFMKAMEISLRHAAVVLDQRRIDRELVDAFEELAGRIRSGISSGNLFDAESDPDGLGPDVDEDAGRRCDAVLESARLGRVGRGARIASRRRRTVH